MFVLLAETHRIHFPPLNDTELPCLLYFLLRACPCSLGDSTQGPMECQVLCAKGDMQISTNPLTVFEAEKRGLVLRKSSVRLSAVLLLVLQTQTG